MLVRYILAIICAVAMGMIYAYHLLRTAHSFFKQRRAVTVYGFMIRLAGIGSGMCALWLCLSTIPFILIAVTIVVTLWVFLWYTATQDNEHGEV